ncbi:MAG: hypothetical protein KDH96_04130 [Candidatus Riesia sp.]|nr:hypothetical protein [Candidatus Riesia sp.]
MAIDPTCITASFLTPQAQGVEITASFLTLPGYTDITASFKTGTLQETDITASFIVKSFEQETYEAFVEQIPVLPTRNYSGVSGGTSYATDPGYCPVGSSGIEASGITPPTSLNNFYTYKFKIEVVGDTNFDFTDYQLDFTINEKRNSPTELTFRISDHEGIFNPENPTTGGLGALRSDFNNGATVNRYYQVTVKVGDQTEWVSPRFLQVDYDWVHDGESAIATITALDYSQLLLASQDDGLDDYVSGSGRIWYASQIIADILPRYGVTQIDAHRFTDYPVPKYSPKGGTPLEWMKELLFYAQAEWYFDDNVLVIKDRDSETVEWELKDIYHLANWKQKKTARDIYNEFVVSKDEAISSTIARNHCVGRNCLGYQTVSWSQPLNIASLYIRNVVRGTIDEVDWRDEAGEPVTNIPRLTHMSQTPMRSVSFVYTPSLGAINSPTAWPPSVLPEYEVIVQGRVVNTDPVMSIFDDKFKVRKKSTEHQLLFGPKKAAPVNSPIIGTREQAELLARKLLEESLRKGNTIQTSVNMMNPFMRAATAVKFYVGKAGFPDGQVFYIESISKTGNEAGGLMNINASRFEYTIDG